MIVVSFASFWKEVEGGNEGSILLSLFNSYCDGFWVGLGKGWVNRWDGSRRNIQNERKGGGMD